MLTRHSLYAIAGATLLSLGAHAQVPGLPGAKPAATGTAPAQAAPATASSAPGAAAVAGATTATAQAAATPQLQPRLTATPATGPAQPPPADPMSLPSAVDAELKRLAASQRQSEVLSAEVQLLTLQNQVEELRKQTAGNQAGTTGLPQLVGMISTADGVAAEFLAGGALLQVSQGDWVSAEWRLSKVMNNGVEITRANGRERHTLMFGGTAQRAATAYEAR